jgi:protein ImuB
MQRLTQQLSSSQPEKPGNDPEKPGSDARQPANGSRPLILAARDPRRGQVVAAVNLAGRQAGVRPAMRLSEATALVTAEVHQHDPQEDIEELCSLAEQAQRFSPLVGIEQLDKQLWSGRTLRQPQGLLLDVTGIAPLFGGETELLQSVCLWLSEQSYFGCVALAGNVGAAWALANYQLRHTGASPSPSHEPHLIPACRHCRAPLGEDLAAIAPLPIAALRLASDTVHTLGRLGIQTIDQLAQLPRSGLATRLGEHLLLRWDQAAGRRHENILSLHSSPDWHLEQTLEYPTPYRATMEELIRRLTGQLADRLQRRGEGALRIVCRLDLVAAPPLVMQLGLFRPNSDPQHLQTLLVGQLEQQLARHNSTGSPAPLWRVSVQATLTAPLMWRQIDLFEAGETVNRQQIARLVDTLSSRLGRKQVLMAQVRREAQPELSYSLQPLTGRRPDGSEQDIYRKLSSRQARQRGEPSREDPQRRPTQIFSPPLEIQVAHQRTEPAPAPVPVPNAIPQTAPGQPANASPAAHLPSVVTQAVSLARFFHQGQWLEIIDSTGPERLESGWWRGPSVRRDYFRVATSQAGWWWIYRDLSSGQWYVHGQFD